MDIQRPISKQFMPDDAKLVHKGIIFDVYQWEIEGYDGKKKVFEKLKRPDTIKVIPVTTDGQIILAHQEQPGKASFLGLLGGRADPGESPLEVAQRELLEESGYQTNDWKLFDAIQPISKIDWAVYTFIAKGVKKISEQNLDGAEKVDLVFLSFEEFVDVVTQPSFDDIELRLKVLEAKLDQSKMSALRNLILGE